MSLIAGPADAQQLQRLHVLDITLSSSTLRPVRDVPFNVVVTIRVADDVHLQNVFLPYFAGPEELGDIREERNVPGKTVYRETLTLVAHTPGLLEIGPAYLDAIDARDGKPKRFSSNVLQLRVPGAVPSGEGRGFPLIAFTLTAFVVACVAVGRIAGTRTPPSIPQTAAPPCPDFPDDFLGRAIAQLRGRRDRASVLQVRSALWRLAGAPAGSTLYDVLQLPTAVDDRLRSLLMRVERACFVSGENLPAAIDEVLNVHEVTFA